MVQLDEVVITGQYNPQSAKNSLYKVRSVSLERIEAQAANTISQVLSQELNIRLAQDPALGSTGMTIQGMGGRNVKILVDGVPLIGNTGNNSDLSQININNIERVEIVEGPMAVNYGSNALAGVVNIITKSSSASTLDLNVDIHEESVGGEYGANEGIHRQALDLGYQVNDRLNVRGDFSRNYFGGFQGNSTGRSKEWLPKTQYMATAGFSWNLSESLDISYKFDYLDELIDSYAEPSSIFNPIALDEEYKTNRYVNSLQFNQTIKDGRINAIFAYSDYKRRKTQYAHDLRTGEKPLSSAEGAQDTSYFKTWTLRGSVTNRLSDNINYELGYDINLDRTGGGRIKDGQEQSISDLAAFGSFEWQVNKFKVRPGLRYAYNSRFTSPVVPSINLKYDLNETWKIRGSYGMGFRAPTLRELYFEFVDSNHNVLGNEDLNPETSDHIDLGFIWSPNQSTQSVVGELNLFYNNIDDQITFGQSAEDPRVTTYVNVNKFRSAGFTITGKYRKGAFSTNTGFSYYGTYNSFDGSQEDLPLQYTPEIKSEISYAIHKWGLTPSLYYKYNGRLSQYFLSTNSDGEQESYLGTTDDFHWADLTLAKSFGNSITLTGGVRNLFDVKNINSTSTGGSVHGGGGSVPVGYGRSYFIRLNYHLTKTKK